MVCRLRQRRLDGKSSGLNARHVCPRHQFFIVKSVEACCQIQQIETTDSQICQLTVDKTKMILVRAIKPTH